jgi:ribosomal protein L16/L10AE
MLNEQVNYGFAFFPDKPVTMKPAGTRMVLVKVLLNIG